MVQEKEGALTQKKADPVVPAGPAGEPASELKKPKGEDAKKAAAPAPKADGKPVEVSTPSKKATNMEDTKPAEQPICNGRNKGECELGTLVQQKNQQNKL